MNILTLDSREVVKMVGKEHRHLIRDIRKYIEDMEDSAIDSMQDTEEISQSKFGLTESSQPNFGLAKTSQIKIEFADFFIESNYTDDQGKTRPCYLVTRKGCEFIANKLTGYKGTVFTASYINRFHEMEETLRPAVIEPINCYPQTQRLGEVVELAKTAIKLMEKQNRRPYEITAVAVEVLGKFGITMPKGMLPDKYKPLSDDGVKEFLVYRDDVTYIPICNLYFDYWEFCKRNGHTPLGRKEMQEQVKNYLGARVELKRLEDSKCNSKRWVFVT